MSGCRQDSTGHWQGYLDLGFQKLRIVVWIVRVAPSARLVIPPTSDHDVFISNESDVLGGCLSPIHPPSRLLSHSHNVLHHDKLSK